MWDQSSFLRADVIKERVFQGLVGLVSKEDLLKAEAKWKRARARKKPSN